MFVDSTLCAFLLFLGRGAGGAFGKWSKVCSPLIGVVFGLLVGVNDVWLAAFAVAGWLSEKPDPASDSLGAVTDGRADVLDYALLAFRGFVGAVPYLCLVFVAPTLYMLSFIVAWPLVAYIGYRLPFYTAWEWSEILRYFMVGVFVILLK